MSRKNETVIGHESFITSLELVLEEAKKHPTISVKEITNLLSGKGYAAFLILLSFPFCIPIQIPGISTPFGIILIFIGFRLIFAKRLWWPKKVLKKKLSSKMVKKLCLKMIKVLKILARVIKPRLYFFVRTPLIKRINGALIITLALLLSLPLPVPLSNFLAATPILLIGVGLLEDDGLMIILGYSFATICFAAFLSILLLAIIP